MSKLFVSPYKPEDWTGREWKVQIDFQVEPDVLAEAIKRRWPEVEIQVNPAPDTPVEWTFLSLFFSGLAATRTRPG
jgi:hypothetical protein